jgi:hypothetical protein
MIVVRCTRACLDSKSMLVSPQLDACGPRIPIGFVTLEFSDFSSARSNVYE